MTTTMLQRVIDQNQTLQAQLTAALYTKAALIRAVREHVADEKHFNGCLCRLCVELARIDAPRKATQ